MLLSSSIVGLRCLSVALMLVPLAITVQGAAVATANDCASSETLIKRADNVPPCSVEEIAETQCMGPKDCLYVNPDDCGSFIQCTVNVDGKTGTPEVMDCPAGLEWDDSDKTCDYPSSSTCVGNAKRGISLSADVGKGKLGILKRDGIDDVFNDMEPACIASAAQEVNGQENCGEVDGVHMCIFAHPNDCSKYLICKNGVYGKAFSCGCGEEWDADIRGCVENKESVRCALVKPCNG